MSKPKTQEAKDPRANVKRHTFVVSDRVSTSAPRKGVQRHVEPGDAAVPAPALIVHYVAPPVEITETRKE